MSNIDRNRKGRQGKAAAFALLVLGAIGASPAAAVEWGENHPGPDWREITTEHFRVIAPAAHVVTATRAAAVAEEAFGPVTGIVGGAPPGRIDIVIRDWSDVSGGRSYSSWPRIEIEPYPLDREVAEIDFLRQVVVHEFTHVATYYAVGGEKLEAVRAPAALLNLPDWWVEGLPSALEKPRTEPREMDFVRMIARSGEIPRRHRLDDIDQGDRYDDVLVYWVGESMVRWIVDRCGAETIARVHAAMRPIPWSFDRALRSVTGMSEAEVYDAWKEDLLAALAEEPAPPEPLESHPLPDWLERPLTFAYSSKGDLAVVAVRDEDVWWPELYVQRGGEGDPELIDPGPVWPKVSWNGDGTRLAYSRLTPGSSDADTYELYVFGCAEETTIRWTAAERVVEPVWKPGVPELLGIAYGAEQSTAALLSIDRARGELRLKGFPSSFRAPLGLAPLGEVAPYFTALSEDGGRRLGFAWGYGDFLRAFTFHDDAPKALFDPVFHRTPRSGRQKVLLVTHYEAEIPTLIQPLHWKGGGTMPRHALPGYVRDPSIGPENELSALTASGRYRSRIARLDLSKTIDEPPSGRILWHQKPVIADTPRGVVPEERFPTGAYSTIGNIRPRPVALVNTVDTDGFDASLENLLADPTNRHNLDVDGASSWDRETWNLLGTYRNRQLLPTIYLQGGYGEAEGTIGGEPWREVAKRAALTLRVPFRHESYFIRYALSGGLTHLRSARTGNLEPEIDRRETMGFLRLAREVNRPRRNTLLALRGEHGVDLFSPAILPERFEIDARFSHAVFRNDGFLSLTLSGEIETAAEKRSLLLLPSNITAPMESASGTRTLLYGAGFAYPWSEDLALPLGPFTFERLTHRIEYREGRAWDDDDRESVVRSAWTELDLRVFSARLFPFSGANTLHLRAGVAHEIDDRADPEWYFAISSDFWNERWTGEPASRDLRATPPLHLGMPAIAGGVEESYSGDRNRRGVSDVVVTGSAGDPRPPLIPKHCARDLRNQLP